MLPRSCASIGRASLIMETFDLFALDTSSGPTSCAADSPARTLATRGSAKGSTANARDSGPSSPELLASFDRATSSWKTSQLCLDGELSEFSETWPRSGLMRSGIAYRLQPLAPLTDAIASGFWPTPHGMSIDPATGKYDGHGNELSQAILCAEGLSKTTRSVGRWPTPTMGDAKSTGSRNTAMSKAHPGVSLTDAVRGDEGTGRNPRLRPGTPTQETRTQPGRMWPTPVSSDRKSGAGSPEWYASRQSMTRGLALNETVGGSLNPTWVEWLMGFPLGWTALDASATPSSRKSRKSSGGPS